MPNLPRIYAVSERQDRENKKPHRGRKLFASVTYIAVYRLIEKIRNPIGDGNNIRLQECKRFKFIEKIRNPIGDGNVKVESVFLSLFLIEKIRNPIGDGNW